MRPMFLDRRDAGRRLAALLAGRNYPNPLVLALPRGGVPVGAEVAHALSAALDVFIVRKLGVPGHPELAMGAIASGGTRVLNTDIITSLDIPTDAIRAVTAEELRELSRRERYYRGRRPFPAVKGRTIIIVDDGVATGATMVAAVRALRTLKAAHIVASAPVIAAGARSTVSEAADECVAVAAPELDGISSWYLDFTQTTDDEVRALVADEEYPAPASAGGG